MVGLLWTKDFTYAWKDLRIKLPLIIMPVIFCSYRQWLKTVKYSFLYFFSIVLYSYMFFSILESLFYQKPLHDVLILSHIRLSLMIGIGFSIALFYMINNFQGWKFLIGFVILSGVTFLYLIYLNSFTGYLSFFFVLVVFIVYYLGQLKRKYVISLLTVMVLGLVYFGREAIWVKNTCFPEVGFFERTEPRENGNSIYQNVNISEVIHAWNMRSTKKIENDRDSIFHILLRYLASRGYSANNDGVWKLSVSDVNNIEKGLTNYRLVEMNLMQKKFYTFFWEWYAYIGSRQYVGHSIPQRLHLWQLGWKVFKENWMFGVGTGDIQQIFIELKRSNQIVYADGKILRPHQQFITIGIQLGILGILFLVLLVFLLVFLAFKEKNVLFIIFASLMILSMMYEDTLETQVGVSLFSIFTSFYITQKMERYEYEEGN
ncbi:MAG: O-antigen ligase family protein [Bacteroidales bacterium]|nr:O-antigen ligase family protein [Bacteroidales bacterium]